ncbi:hypothetical protein NBO_175g0002 [Nosema bombycis CQ1]|uniref:Uncharacterized protein n=1 Tax=Nosema bombycis (strain CQ1 / CVCC 102059) TaxID=578461 RepID=R0KQU5_NOSB1|nr:hypothetical protein NBO_175g0002 [Nosema bombycis CQ1]|eukprot:EOB13111.1 hypothetical protein NBO_175g0002 [Nosema bombycis CQ1]
MKCTTKCLTLETIMEQLRDLHSIMIKVLPKEHLNQHPFDFFKDELNLITKLIDGCKLKFIDKLNKTKEVSKILIKEYKHLVRNLNLEECVIPKFNNAHMEVEFVLNELERIISKRRQLENLILRKSEDIYELLGELGLLKNNNDDIIFNLIDDNKLNVDRISISSKMIHYKERFLEYEELFLSAGLHKLFVSTKDLFIEKHFKFNGQLQFEKTHLNFNLKLQEENEELYSSLRIKNNENVYQFIDFLLGNQEISFEKLSKLETCHKILYIEKMEKEKTRRFLFKNTSNLLKRLGFVDRELFIDQKLFILEELNQKYTKMVEEREKEVLELLNSIRNKEEILNLNIKDFKEGFRKKDENTSYTSIINDSFLTMDNVLTTDISRNEDSAIKSEKSFIKEVNGSITNSNMDHLRNYLKELSEEYESRIQEIFINTKTYLEELCKLFTLKIDDYEVSTEGINLMRKTIEDLEPKKELYLEIISLIQKRDELLVSMNEFEKIASDPRRLFKSSFQLLREEKF